MSDKHTEAKPYEPIDFPLSKKQRVQVMLDVDRDEVTVHLYGPGFGELMVLPSSDNSVRLRAIGGGILQPGGDDE